MTVIAAVILLVMAGPAPALGGGDTYRNPLEPTIAGDGVVQSCADPAAIRGQQGEGRWYLYCTTDPLNDDDRLPDGSLRRIGLVAKGGSGFRADFDAVLVSRIHH